MSSYHFIFDYIGGFFWSVTYILIAFTGFINKKDTRIAMPIVSLTINFSWETASIIKSCIDGLSITRGNFIRFSWFLLDILIIIVFYKKQQQVDVKRNKFKFCVLSWAVLTTVFALLFFFTEYGMPVSSFIIDIHMAIMFFCYRKHLDPSNRVFIAAAKLLGDICAWLAYGDVHYSIVVLGAGSFIFNTLYILYAIKEIRMQPDINNAFRNGLNEFFKLLEKRLLKEKTYQKRRKYKKKKKQKKTHRKH